MYKRWVYRSNGKLYPFGIEIAKLACMLKTYRTYSLMVGFLKYEFNNKLLGGITFFRVTSSVTWT